MYITHVIVVIFKAHLLYRLCMLLLISTNPTWCQHWDMASLGFSPPDPFNFQCPDGWTTWKRRFDCFRSTSGLSKESEPRQVSALLYCMGEQSDSVLNSTNISNEDREKYASVMSKFDEYFKVSHNVIFERAQFNRLNQLFQENLLSSTSQYSIH